MGPNVLRTPPSSSAAEDKRSRNDQSVEAPSARTGMWMRAGGEYTTLEGRGVEGHRPKSPGLVFRGQQSRGSGGSAQRDGAETSIRVVMIRTLSVGNGPAWGRRGYSGRQRLRREEHGWEERNTVQQHFNTLSTLLFAGPSFGGGARREVIFEVRRGIKERYCLLEEGQ
ncbi:hypothetical protein KC343_g44 [Hortaea werneckii]|nr:hypothetical protein KC343_g44 [Hortaea werneckii]